MKLPKNTDKKAKKRQAGRDRKKEKSMWFKVSSFRKRGDNS